MKINKYNEFRNISGSVLKELRLKANLSQQDLAEKLQLLGIELNEFFTDKLFKDVEEDWYFAVYRNTKISFDI